jgi:hypothetical protein
MSVFEDHGRDKRLELVVLPPKRPGLNGCVERAHSSWRYEFHPSYELPHRIDKLQPLVESLRSPIQQPKTPPGPWRSYSSPRYLKTLSPEISQSHIPEPGQLLALVPFLTQSDAPLPDAILAHADCL